MYVMFCKNGSMNHIWDLSKIDVYNVQRFFRPVIIRNKSWEKNIVKVKWGLNDLLEGLYWVLTMMIENLHNLQNGGKTPDYP